MKLNNKKTCKIAIFGIGLIGGSICRKMKSRLGKKVYILGKCKNKKKSLLARNQGLIDEVIDDDLVNLKDVSFIVLATPIKESKKLLEKIAKVKRQKCIILDVGSTKKEISQFAKKIKNKNVTFVATHPIAGGEKSGFENSDEDLFDNKTWIVCKSKKNSKNDLNLIKDFIESLNANMIELKSSQHDKLLAFSSHLNLAVSSIIVNTLLKNNDYRNISKILSTGFGDTTGLASFNPKLKKEILLTNKENVLLALISFRKELDLFLNILENSKNKKLELYLTLAKKQRDKWLDDKLN